MTLLFCWLVSASAAEPPLPPFWTYPAGDVNGDGLIDVVVATDPHRQGVVQVYHGLPDGTLPTEPATTLRPDPCYDDDHLTAVFAADLDADGYSDLVVAMVGREQYRGAAMVYTGGPSGIHTDRSIVLDPGPLQGNDLFASTGALLARSGEFDLYLGAPQIGSGPAPGQVYRFVTRPGAIEATPATVLTVDAPTGFRFGRKLAEGGDLDADGHPDLIATATRGGLAGRRGRGRRCGRRRHRRGRYQ